MISSSEFSGKITIEDDWDLPSSNKNKMAYKEEPLLKENPGRFVLFPIHYHEIWQAYKNAEAKFWSAEEIELAEDTYSFESLSGKEKAFLIQSFSLLTSTDRLLGKSIFMPFGSEIQVPEARCYFGFQMMQENIHKELYNLFLQIFSERFLKIENANEEEGMVTDTVNEFPSLSKKLAWAQQYILESDEHFSLKIIALGVYEYLFSCSTSAMMLFFAHVENKDVKNLIPFTRYKTEFPGLVKSTAKIMRERRSTLRFVAIIKDLLVNKPSQEYVTKIIKQVVEIEKETVREMLMHAGNQLSLNGTMVNYQDIALHIEFQANECANVLGYQDVFPNTRQTPLKNVMAVYTIESENDGDEPTKMPSSAPVSKNTESSANQAFTLNADF